MDRFATVIANLLVGNEANAALLEATFMGPELGVHGGRLGRGDGGELPPKVNGEERPTWESFPVKAGDRLTFGFLKGGARAYIAISGGYRRSRRAGVAHDLRARRAGRLRGPRDPGGRRAAGGRGAEDERGAACRSLCGAAPPAPPSCACCPASTGTGSPKAPASASSRGHLKVAPEADRIGYRFKAARRWNSSREQPFGAGSDPSNIVDACYPYGSVQVPSGTEPIVLHRDAVSGGGYMMLGVVISADMDLIAQLQPHTPARFQPVTLDQALAARADAKTMLQRARDHVAG